MCMKIRKTVAIYTRINKGESNLICGITHAEAGPPNRKRKLFIKCLVLVYVILICKLHLFKAF